LCGYPEKLFIVSLETRDNYQFCYFDSNDSILYHEVTDENFGTKELFVMSMSRFTSLIDKYQPKALIIKVIKKPDFYEQGFKTFMQSAIIKLIYDLQIKKIAFYLKFNDFFEVLKTHEQETPVKVRFFLDLEEAKKWVLVKE
jgi:hypothetical protein